MSDDFRADISDDLARAAHQHTSFTPDVRARQERDDYAATIAGDFERLSKFATTDEKRAALADAFAAYRAGYAQRFRAMLAARSRCASTMITGGSGFNVARNRKRNSAADKRTAELAEYRTRTLAAITRTLTPEAQPIRASDGDAVDRLRAKLERLRTMHGLMTSANKAIRTHAKAGSDAQVAALVALGLSAKVAAELLKPDFCGRIGFADYQIKNSSAEIRRCEARITDVGTAQSTPDEEIAGPHGTMSESAADNRIRVTFPGKPNSDVRARLKAAGFRWSPSIGAWSAYRTHAARMTGRAIIGADAQPATSSEALAVAPVIIPSPTSARDSANDDGWLDRLDLDDAA